MIPTILDSLKLPEGYNLFFGDSCIIPASMDYRLFDPKLWYICYEKYKSAIIDLTKKIIIIKDTSLKPLLEEYGRIHNFTVSYEKVDTIALINRRGPRDLFL